MDLVPHFGFAIPFRVICELLGLAVSERSDFHQMGAARFDLTQGGMGVFQAATESRTFLIDAVTRQRREPGNGLIGAVLSSHGNEFSDVELGGLMDGVFLGGYETSASMLSMGVLVLGQHPDAYSRLRTGFPRRGRCDHRGAPALPVPGAGGVPPLRPRGPRPVRSARRPG